MPYIITPGIQTTDAGTNFDGHAVETIEEAREAAFDRMAEVPRYDLADAARISESIHNLPETGGTIGPLPDGYVIDVRFVSHGGLWKLATGSKARQPIDTGDIIDAFNGGA